MEIAVGCVVEANWEDWLMKRERGKRMIPRLRLIEEENLFIMDRGKRYAGERTG